jgi:hypothetical protein
VVQIHPDPPLIRAWRGWREANADELTPDVFRQARRARSATAHGGKQTSQGAIAQLGEHLLCKQGVVGSIPTGSTIFWLGIESAAVSVLGALSADLLIRQDRFFNNLGSCCRYLNVMSSSIVGMSHSW